MSNENVQQPQNQLCLKMKTQGKKVFYSDYNNLFFHVLFVIVLFLFFFLIGVASQRILSKQLSGRYICMNYDLSCFSCVGVPIYHKKKKHLLRSETPVTSISTSLPPPGQQIASDFISLGSWQLTFHRNSPLSEWFRFFFFFQFWGKENISLVHKERADFVTKVCTKNKESKF